jgi:hypothetical protein
MMMSVRHRKQIKNVKKYFKDPNLTVENMAMVSKAGKGLLVWVMAITKYYDVAKNVEPLRIKVRPWPALPCARARLLLCAPICPAVCVCLCVWGLTPGVRVAAGARHGEGAGQDREGAGGAQGAAGRYVHHHLSEPL